MKRRGRIYMIAIAAGIALGVALGVAGGVLVGLSARTDDIQRSRAENVRSACLEQNARNRASLSALDTVLAKAGVGAGRERKEQLRQSRESTALLINALAPRRNCELRVKQLVGASPAD